MYNSNFSEVLGSSIGGIVILLVIIWLIARFARGKSKVVHLALMKFIIDPNAEDQIILIGRKTGLIAWFMTQLNLGNKYMIHIGKDYITYSAESWSGKELILTPVQKIASTVCSYTQPVGMLIGAGAMLVLGLFLGLVGIILILVAVVLVVLFIYSKNFAIHIQTTSGAGFGFSFKRSFIENVPVDFDKVREAVYRINTLVLESNKQV